MFTSIFHNLRTKVKTGVNPLEEPVPERSDTSASSLSDDQKQSSPVSEEKAA